MSSARSNSVQTVLALVGLTLALPSCGGGGGGGGAAPAPPTPTANVLAVAGQDLEAVTGQPVQLDASFSVEKSLKPLTYSWSQTAGTAVTLSSSTAASPTFTAPASAGDLTFQVSVSNGEETATDTVVVRAKPFVAKAGRQRTSQATSTGGATVVGTKNFTVSGGTNFNAAGVAPGDTLLVLTGADFGAYRINKVASNTSLIVQRPVTFTGSTPATWVILNENPYFYGYGVAGTVTTVLMGASTGSVTYAWTGAQSSMPVTGTSTATVSFTTPKLPDLLPLPEEPSVLSVRSGAMGRYQFKVTVTDDNGTAGDATDDVVETDVVNLSAGVATSGIDNVPLGEPVFLSGGTVRKQETSSGFTLEAGTTYTYRITETATVRSVREITTPLIPMTSIASVDGTPGSWYWAAGVLYVHASDDSVVTSNGKDYHAFVADNWSWVVTDPTGAAVSLFRPNRSSLGSATDERTPYFIPTRLGKYPVILDRTIGATVDTKTFTINAAQFVGTGTIVGTAPSAQKGECGSCHGGSVAFLANVRADWEQTGHANTLANALDPTSSAWATYQAQPDWRDVTDLFRRGTGTSYVNPFDQSLASTTTVLPTSTASGHLPNNAIDDRGVYSNFDHLGLTWDQVKEQFPNVAALGNVQCESCHGPGSQHVADTTGIRKSMDEGVCGRCHNSFPTQWDLAAHSRIVVSPSGNATCVNCHEASASAIALKKVAALEEPRPVFFADSANPLPVIPEHERRGETCAVCHDPHKPTAGTAAGDESQQLRLIGQVQLMDGTVIEAGKAAACYMCHQSRTNTTDYTPVTGMMAIRRAPHDSTAAEMLVAANAPEFAGWNYKSSPHALDNKFIVPGKSENNRCVTCHMEVSPSAGSSGYQALGGHTWNMKQGGTVNGDPAEIASELTHGGGAVVAGSKAFIITSGPTFLGRVVAGDRLVLENGSDAGTFTITSVDNGAKITVSAGSNFSGASQPTQWHVDSLPKYNTGACSQCHPSGPAFEFTARADYDGDSNVETVEEEVHGLATALKAVIETGVNDPALPKGLSGGPYTVVVASGRVSYKNAAGTTRNFPGPSGSSPQQTDWDALTPEQQARWELLYKAAYCYFFQENDHSEGIHNTGYAVNLLQAAYKNVTGVTLGAAFVPPVGFEN